MDMILSTGWTKTVSTWAAGSDSGMLDTGSIAPNLGYHVYLIFNPITTLYDILCSLSATAPAMPSGFTKRRRIGAFVTDADGNIRYGVWYANGDFRFKAAISAVLGAPGDFLTLKVLPIPSGVKFKVQGQVFGAASDNSAFWIIVRDPDLGTIADTNTQWWDAVIYKSAGGNNGATFTAWTDTAAQVYHVAYPRLSTNLIYIYLQGWTDTREEFS